MKYYEVFFLLSLYDLVVACLALHRRGGGGCFKKRLGYLLGVSGSSMRRHNTLFPIHSFGKDIFALKYPFRVSAFVVTFSILSKYVNSWISGFNVALPFMVSPLYYLVSFYLSLLY